MKKTDKVQLPDGIRKYILEHDLITADQLAKDFEISNTTASTYLSRTITAGIATKIAPKTIIHAPRDLPELTAEKKRVLSVIREQMPFIEISIWSSQDLNKYAHNIIAKSLVVVEVGEKVGDAVKDTLQSKAIKAVLYTSKQDAKTALELPEKPVLVINRSDKTGTIQDARDPHLHNPTFEKIFVDAYFLSTRKNIGPPSSEIAASISNVFGFKHALQLSLLNAVAQRRHVEKEFHNLFYQLRIEHPDYPIPEAYAQKIPLTPSQAKHLKTAIGGIN
ncbi:MAG: DUF6577 family protein [Candidatus Micrarchaeota archaeon]